jgi:hypothetical protein
MWQHFYRGSRAIRRAIFELRLSFRSTGPEIIGGGFMRCLCAGLSTPE